MSPNSQPRGILFDLDGTLLHTAPDLVKAINQLRHEYHLAALPFESAISMVGKGAQNLVKRALADAVTTVDLTMAYQQFSQHYHAINGDSTEEYAEVSNGLSALHRAGFKLAIVTNKPSEFTLPLLTQFGWKEYFGSIVCGDTLTHKKPHPAPILHACSELDISVSEALMVGDSMNDVLAAQAANCQCVVFNYGYNEGVAIEHALTQNNTVRIFSHFDQLVASLS
jgi:phosphoglycolate phosphatase